jgi:hypothetical protein
VVVPNVRRKPLSRLPPLEYTGTPNQMLNGGACPTAATMSGSPDERLRDYAQPGSTPEAVTPPMASLRALLHDRRSR